MGKAFVLAEGNEGITFGTTVAVTGGAIAGGSANITAGTGGVTANVSGMIGVGFNIVSGFAFGGVRFWNALTKNSAPSAISR